MIKTEKKALIEALKPMFDGAHLYLVDCEGLTANQLYKLRYQLFQANVVCKQVPNALLRILFSGTVYDALTDLLKRSSLLMFAKDDAKKPAEIIKEFRKKERTEKPLLKGAWANDDVFIGNKSLDELMKLKSREELIAQIIHMLQAPGQQLARALRSSQDKLCGAIKTIQDK